MQLDLLAGMVQMWNPDRLCFPDMYGVMELNSSKAPQDTRFQKPRFVGSFHLRGRLGHGSVNWTLLEASVGLGVWGAVTYRPSCNFQNNLEVI